MAKVRLLTGQAAADPSLSLAYATITNSALTTAGTPARARATGQLPARTAPPPPAAIAGLKEGGGGERERERERERKAGGEREAGREAGRERERERERVTGHADVFDSFAMTQGTRYVHADVLRGGGCVPLCCQGIEYNSVRMHG